jgi:uncharacterized protein (DUF1501 family)
MARSVCKGCDDFRQTSGADRARWLAPRLTRRQAIGGALGGALAIWARPPEQAMPFAHVLEAASAQAAAAPSAPVLVTVFLPGGCDLLDTLVPVGQFGRYADLRPGTRVASPTLLGGTGVGVHPSLTEGLGGGVKGLYDAGKVGFLPGIDYANPDLSHFHSRHFWETGLVTERAAPGWLGRWLDRHGSRTNPLQGLTLGSTLSPVLATAAAPVAALESPGDVALDVWGVDDHPRAQLLSAWERMAAGGGHAPGPAAVHDAARLAKRVGDELAPYAARNGVDPLAPPVAYPKDDQLGQRLSTLAALIAKPLGVRLAAVDADGQFDTHDDQPKDLAAALSSVSQSLAAFQADLEARGVADRVLTLVWSEFGRRPQGNESNGSDHGAGGVAWVQGTHAASGILTDYPSLTDLDREDNLRVTVDFRKVYSSLIEGWLGTDASEVIPSAGAYGRLSLVR